MDENSSDDGYEGVTHAGIALVVPSKGVVLLAQRALDEDDDPDVRETWEFVGGGIEDDEDPQAAAFREFEEETGRAISPNHEVVGGWRSDDGVYQGFVVSIPIKQDLAWFDPNDEVQAIDWFTRDEVESHPSLRPEMANTDWDMVFGAVSGNSTDEGDSMDDDQITEDEVDEMEEPIWDALLASVTPIPVHGVVAPEGVATGDRRKFAAGSITSRPLRLPFSHQKAAIGGHDGSIVVGSVDRMMRKDGLIHWEGLLMPAEDTDEFVNLLSFFGKTGVSVDGDNGSLDMDASDAEDMAVFDAVRASGLTSVAIPAFHEAYVAFGHHPEMPSAEQDETLTASMHLSGDLIGGRITFDRGPGWVTNPKETNRLHDYWTKKGQPGYAKIAWGTPGDFTRAKALIGEKIAKNSPDKMRFLNQIIAQWHFDALGYWPGDWDKPGNDTTAEGRAKRKANLSLESVLADVDGLEPVVKNAAGEEVETEWEAVLVSSVAGGERVRPSAHYFDRHPDTGNLTIEDPDEYGFRRVHGYAAEWGVCHIGFSGRCVEPPRTFSDEYPEFHLGRTKTDEGFVKTGVLTYNVGHRDAQTILSESATQAHFDNLLNAWSAVRLGEDDRGIWFSGVVLPKVDEDDIDLIHASGQVSGEWKSGALRACLAVNTPGFPVMQASAIYGDDGEMLALSASSFTDTLTASVNGVADSPCAPTPLERLAALRVVDAEIRFDALRAQFNAERGI